jgi:F420-0:gamma-glutamyl ligase-like protein
MKIHEYYYNEDTRRLYVEFSTKKDGDKFYRIIEFDFSDIKYYSPEIITEEDLTEIDKSFITDLLNQYLEDNDLPEEIIL